MIPGAVRLAERPSCTSRRKLSTMKRSSAAQQVLDEFDAELQASAAQAGRSLGWSAAERATLAMIADSIDRRVELAAAYNDTGGDVKEKIKLSREIRLQEGATARLLKLISTDVPQPESLVSIKNRRAANARWHPNGD
jgi:succinylarginine dihydrolase